MCFVDTVENCQTASVFQAIVKKKGLTATIERIIQSDYAQDKTATIRNRHYLMNAFTPLSNNHLLSHTIVVGQYIGCNG